MSVSHPSATQDHLRVALVHDYRERVIPSMRLYGDLLGAALARHGVTVEHLRCPDVLPQRWQRGVVEKLDSYVGRFLSYPRLLRGVSADVVHVVDHGQAHLLSALAGHRTVVTCHDLILLLLATGHLRAPFHPPAVATAVLRHAIRKLRRADAVVADSERTRLDLAELAGIDPARVRVIYPGLNYPLAPDGERREATRKGLGLSDRYVLLHVGHSGFYKNIEGCLEAVRRLRRDGLEVTFVRAGRRMTPEQAALAERLGVAPFLQDLGLVGVEELADLYRAADVLLFPSLYEGFGWPPLEAMASGLPVVCSTAGSLPEVVGQAALTTRPDDLEMLVRHVASVLTDRSVAADLRTRGLARAKLFDWDRSAMAMLEVYRRVAENGPGFQERAARPRHRQRSREAPGREDEVSLCRIYSVFGRDIFAIPDGSDRGALGIDSMPGVTARARGARILLRTLRHVGAERAATTVTRGLPGIANARQVEGLVAEIRRNLGAEAAPIFLFPPPSRPGRLYVHLVSPEGERLGFAKVALVPSGKAWLESEMQAFTRFASKGEHFHIPRPLAIGETAGFHYLLSEAIPRTAKPFTSRWTGELDAVLSDLAGETRHAVLRTCSWWPALEMASASVPGLRMVINKIVAQDAEICAAHGDFTHWNMYRDHGRLWLIDWEFSAPDAPREADRLRFLLGQHTRAANRHPGRVARRIARSFGAEWPERRVAALQALAFLHARTVREAKAVLEVMAADVG